MCSKKYCRNKPIRVVEEKSNQKFPFATSQNKQSLSMYETDPPYIFLHGIPFVAALFRFSKSATKAKFWHCCTHIFVLKNFNNYLPNNRTNQQREAN
jgi:hypothetical protein